MNSKDSAAVCPTFTMSVKCFSSFIFCFVLPSSCCCHALYFVPCSALFGCVVNWSDMLSLTTHLGTNSDGTKPEGSWCSKQSTGRDRPEVMCQRPLQGFTKDGRNEKVWWEVRAAVRNRPQPKFSNARLFLQQLTAQPLSEPKAFLLRLRLVREEVGNITTAYIVELRVVTSSIL